MISREEIELLIVLHAVVGSPCTPRELTVRLGLAPEHEDAVRTAVLPLIAWGYVETDGAISATESGRTWLRSRLAELNALQSSRSAPTAIW
jgi:hypothetical protein